MIIKNFVKKITKNKLELVVFMNGAVIMIYEIVGSRVIAPYFGASTYVWTAVIGTFMAALALGYYMGGEVSDGKPGLASTS